MLLVRKPNKKSVELKKRRKKIFKYFWSKQMLLGSQKYGYGIPDPGVKKATDPWWPKQTNLFNIDILFWFEISLTIRRSYRTNLGPTWLPSFFIAHCNEIWNIGSGLQIAALFGFLVPNSLNQCSGSMTFCGSGSADRCLWLMDTILLFSSLTFKTPTKLI